MFSAAGVMTTGQFDTTARNGQYEDFVDFILYESIEEAQAPES